MALSTDHLAPRLTRLRSESREQRKKEALAYQEYLAKIVELTKKVNNPTAGQAYPAGLNTPAKRALYDNLGKDEALALEVDSAVRASRQDDWRSNPIKIRKVRLAIKDAFRTAREHVPYSGAAAGAGVTGEEPASWREDPIDDVVDRVVELVKNQNEY